MARLRVYVVGKSVVRAETQQAAIGLLHFLLAFLLAVLKKKKLNENTKSVHIFLEGTTTI